MREVPKGWAWTTLNDLASSEPGAVTDGPFGSNLKTEHYTTAGPRVIRLQNIGHGDFLDERAHISLAHYRRLIKHAALPGDVVVALLGDALPRAAVVPDWLGPAVVKADCVRFRPHHLVSPSYLSWALNSPEVRTAARSLVSGVGRPRLNLSKLVSLPIALPPASEQGRIAAAIDEQFSRLDVGAWSLRQAQLRSARLRSAVLATAFRGAWPKKRIGDFAVVGSGATPKRGRTDYYEGGTIPWVTSGQLVDRFVREPATYITETALRETAVRIWPRHTLLVAMYGEGRTRGHCSELLFDSTTNQACAAIVLSDDAPVRRQFLKLFLAASYEDNRRLASGGVQPNLSLELVRSMEVPNPPIEQQDLIVGEVEQRLSVIGSLVTAVDDAFTRGRRLRPSILAQAFMGKLVPQDSADVPASALLECIQAERVDSQPPRRRQRTDTVTR